MIVLKRLAEEKTASQHHRLLSRPTSITEVNKSALRSIKTGSFDFTPGEEHEVTITIDPRLTGAVRWRFEVEGMKKQVRFEVHLVGSQALNQAVHLFASSAGRPAASAASLCSSSPSSSSASPEGICSIREQVFCSADEGGTEISSNMGGWLLLCLRWYMPRSASSFFASLGCATRSVTVHYETELFDKGVADPNSATGLSWDHWKTIEENRIAGKRDSAPAPRTTSDQPDCVDTSRDAAYGGGVVVVPIGFQPSNDAYTADLPLPDGALELEDNDDIATFFDITD